MLSVSVPFAWVLLLLAMGTLGVGLLVMRMPPSRALPRLISLLGFIVASNIAGLRAWLKVLSPSQDATWEPTRRPI